MVSAAFTIDYDRTPGQQFVLVGTREGAAPRFVVPQRFTATTTRDGIRVELTIEVDDEGVPRCTGLELRQRPGAEPITGEALRNVPVARLMREAIEAAASADLRPSPKVVTASAASLSATARIRARGAAVTDDDLRDVAERYRAAVDRGIRSPTQTVANELGAPRSTVARWVHKARDRGFLGPAVRGRAGEMARRRGAGASGRALG
jgi:hypothetical protein